MKVGEKILNLKVIHKVPEKAELKSNTKVIHKVPEKAELKSNKEDYQHSGH
jgi:hypothetical protein